MFDLKWLKQWWGKPAKRKRIVRPRGGVVPWSIDTDRRVVYASTKSEARAAFKTMLGGLDRLPIGTRVAAC